MSKHAYYDKTARYQFRLHKTDVHQLNTIYFPYTGIPTSTIALLYTQRQSCAKDESLASENYGAQLVSLCDAKAKQYRVLLRVIRLVQHIE